MIREAVTSSELRSIGYVDNTHTLEVEFRRGGVYQYFGVSPEAYRELIAAPSIGRFFNSQIKDSHLYRRVE